MNLLRKNDTFTSSRRQAVQTRLEKQDFPIFSQPTGIAKRYQAFNPVAQET